MASPLGAAKGLVAELSGEVERFRQDCARTLQQLDDAGTTGSETRDLCRRCVACRQSAERLLVRVEALSANGEPKKMADFSQRKRQEVRRIQGLQARLSNLASQLEPSDVDNILGGELSAESSETDLPPTPPEPVLPECSMEPPATDDEEDEDQSGSEYELPQAVAISAYTAQQDGDLEIQEGQVVYIVDMTREDGWWIAENESGITGSVPGNHFELIESDSASESVAPLPSPRSQFGGHDDYHGEYQQDEPEDSVEDDDEEEEDEDDDDVELPGPEFGAATFDQSSAAEPEEYSPAKSEPLAKSGASRWKLLKKAVTQPTVENILRSMGAIPSGFRRSTLAELQKKGCHSYRHILEPRIDTTGLLLDGLQWDTSTGSVRPLTAGVMRAVTVLSCRRIPLVSHTLTVLKRQIRVALFDRQKMLGNIQCAVATTAEKDDRTWKFLKIPGRSVTDASFIVRSEELSHSLCILFELAMTCKNNKSGDVVELSCGWGTLDLTNATGTAIANKTFDVKLNGGTPYETSVELEPSAAIDKRFSSLKSSLLQGNAGPSLSVKVFGLNADVVDMANDLPKTIIVRQPYLQSLALYRQLQALDFVASRPFQVAGELPLRVVNIIIVLISLPFVCMLVPICSVLHTTFTQAVDDHQLMDVLLAKLPDALRDYKRDHKQRAPGYKRLVLRDVVRKQLYILLTSPGFPPFSDNSLEKLMVRQQYIERFMQQMDPVSSLFTSTAHQKPFHSDEVAYNLGQVAVRTS